jgi:hypothetical protein
MFKILVDGVEHGRFDDDQAWVHVGSVEDITCAWSARTTIT